MLIDFIIGACLRVGVLAILILCAGSAQAQWITQTISLHPGWNAVYLHVTATNDSLEQLVGATSPISEIWLWQPNQSEGRIISNPLQPISGNDWIQWTKQQGPADAFQLRANSTYLVRNTGTAAHLWRLKGKPVPPTAQWAASGLNFFGYSTPTDNPPFVANFLAQALSSKPFDVFYYPGGEALGVSPNAVPLFANDSARLTRGQAFWIKKQDNSNNRYFGPFEVVLQDYRGVSFSDSLGAYSFRLRNQTTKTNSVAVTFLASEVSPTGETVPPPPLLLRGALDSATLKYSFTNFAMDEARTFVLAPKGRPGSEVEVVLGLDRANLVGANGTSFAGVLRLQDTTLGHLQIDIPVTAAKSSTEGLWVGSASISQVGNYLKSYAKATNAAQFSAQKENLDRLNEAFKTVAFPASPWRSYDIAAASTNSTFFGATHHWTFVASSANGTNLVAAVKGGQLYTSTNAGVTWVAAVGAPATNWQSVASSANGTNLVAAVKGGQLYTSTNAGVTWVAAVGAPATNWQSVASSANGTNLVAAVKGGQLYTSTNAGVTWVEALEAPATNWQSVASSANGTNLIAAVSGGQLYTSTNAGVTWVAAAGAPSTNWQSVASSINGANLVAAVSGGQIYTSTNAGTTWAVAVAAPTANWQSVASSADGTNLVAAVSGGQIYTSINAGRSWVARESNRNWASVASSGEGTNLVAVVEEGRIYTSTNAGVTWSVSAPVLWSSLAASADGTRLLAGAKGGQLYISTDSGTNWIPQAGAPSTNWQAVASSADGQRLVAAANIGQIYTSADAGVSWVSSTGAPSAHWQSVAASADGLKLVAAIDGGDLYTSVDAGQVWSRRIPLANQRWQSVASSADGTKLLAAIKNGQIYASTNSGLNWYALFGAPSASWQAVSTSADGKKLVAVANPGGVYASTDFGVTWDLKAGAPTAANWQAISSSTNGSVLVAAMTGGRIYTSTNSGTTWTAREEDRAWSALASSSDGTTLVAGETGGAGQLYTLSGVLNTPTLTFDTNSNLILSGGGKYLTATFDTDLGEVPTAFPLRLIVHKGTNGVARLLQRVFIGADAITSNSIITLNETNLHTGFLAQARRISAVHLPLDADGWVLKGDFGGTGILNATLTESFDHGASNPFLHSYHPDHDNLDASFEPIRKPGVESYDIKRQITLSFTPPGEDFSSRTVGSSRVQGTYLENIVLKGGDNQTRTVVTQGSFVLNRISSIGTLK